MTKGVTILAIGGSAYGAWAINFAVSLKYHSPDVDIQLICDENNLVETAMFHNLFSVITKIEKENYTNESGELFPAKIKLSLYRYFAFDFTAYFDVDAVVIKDIAPIFDLEKDLYTDVQGVHKIEQGNLFDHLKWAKPETIWKHFRLNNEAQLPAINSSFFLVRKTEQNELLYRTAYDLLFSNHLPLEKYWHKWGRGNGRQADELYMNVACAMLKIIPEKLVAVYFRTIVEPGMAIPLEELQSKYYAIGLFGDTRSLHISAKEYYNRLMGVYWREKIGGNFYQKCETLLASKIVNIRT